MHKLIVLALAASALFMLGCQRPQQAQKRVYIFTPEVASRQVQTEVALLQEQLQRAGLTAVTTNTLEHLQEDSLRQAVFVAFFRIKGQDFTPSQHTDLERFLQAGGGLLGVNSDLRPNKQQSYHDQLLKILPAPLSIEELRPVEAKLSEKQALQGQFLYEKGRLVFVKDLSFHSDARLNALIRFLVGSQKIDYSQATLPRVPQAQDQRQAHYCPTASRYSRLCNR